MLLVGVVRVGDGRVRLLLDGFPLRGARGALGQSPLVLEQRLEVGVVPGGGCGCPRALEVARDRAARVAAAQRVLPADAHLLDGRAFRLPAHVLAGGARGVCLAERVPARDQRDGFLIVHRHPRERLADIPRRRRRVGVAVGALGVHVDQAHLHRAERGLEFAVALVAVVAQPFGFGAPVDPVLGLEAIDPASAEPEGLEPHRFERAVAGEDEQVAPRQFAAVLLLDRPEQTPSLVEVRVVRPTVERREPEHPGAAAAPAVRDAVGPRAVPRHADEEGAVVPVVGGPPLLRIGHQGEDVLLDRAEVERLEFRGVVELALHRVAQRGVATQGRQVELVGPPVAVGTHLERLGRSAAAIADNRATARRRPAGSVACM